MQEPLIIPIRDVLRKHKALFKKVKLTQQPVIVTNNKKPQMAIVSLEEFSQLYHLKKTKHTKALLTFAKIGEHYNLTGPKDLSQNLDFYLWKK